MSLDLGALFATVDIVTAPFDRKYAVLVRQFRQLGVQAEAASAGTSTYERALFATAGAADKMSVSASRASRSTAQAAAAEEKAAAAATRHAEAVARVEAITNPAIATTERLRAAQLRQVAAQERVDALMASGTATTRQLAAANATLISSTRAVTAAQEASTVATSRWRSGLASAGKMAVELGLLIGGIEIARKAIDIGKEAAKFQQNMLLIDTNANAGTAEVKAMTKAVLGLSGQVATGPTELAQALYHVEQNGLRGQKALEALRVGAQGAKIGMADVEDTTNTMTIALASGIHGVGNMQRAMGAMIAIAGTGDMRLKDLNATLSTGILSVAKGFLSSKTAMLDVGAVLATLGDNGIRASDASTSLRQTMMGFAAPAARGKEALKSIGLTMTDLRDDMEKNGLVHAMNLLDERMRAAGITGSKVGGFITEAFGRKAGAGINVLMGEVDRVNTKFEEGEKGAASFAAKWEKTTHTTAFAFQRLGAEFETAGIKAANKLTPAVTAATNWLGDKLPKAVQTAASIVGPFAHEVGSVLGGAWHVVAAVLRVVGSVLGGVTGTLEHHKTLVTVVATAVLSMWAAYRAYTIAVTAIHAVDLALGRLAMRMNRAGGAMAAMRSGIGGISAASVAGGAALAGVGLIIAGVTAAHQEHARQVAMDKAAVDGYTQSIEADSGALGDNTRKLAEHTLASSGAYQQALKLGISQKTLTDAVLGNADAYDQVNTALRAHGALKKDVWQVSLAIGGQVPLLKKAQQNVKDMAAADGKAAGSAHNLAGATESAAAAQKRIAAAEEAAKRAAERLDAALKALAGRLSAHQALDQYRSGLMDLKSQLDENNHSLVGNSAAAVKNRLAVDNVVQGVFQYADALKAQGKTQPQIAAAMRTQVQGLIANARQYGLNRKQLVAYLRLLGLTPSQIATTMLTKTQRAQLQIKELQAKINAIKQGKVPGLTADNAKGRARIAELQREINALRQANPPTVDANTAAALAKIQRVANALASLHDKTVTVTTTNRGISVGGRASGGRLPQGWASVGERGAELTYTSASGTQVFSNSQSKAIIAATGMKAPGFAGGTSGPGPIQTSISGGGGVGTISTDTIHGKKVWLYKGQRYASEMAALNAQERDRKKSNKEGLTDTASLPGVKGIAKVIAGQTGPAARAMRLLSKAVSDAFELKGIEKKIADVKQRITDMKSYRSDVMGTLSGAFDSTHYGSVTDLLQGLSGATATNTAYTAEVDKLRREAKGDKTLTGYINQLAAQGQTPTLEMLSHASKADLQQVSKKVGGYNASLLAGGNAAVVTKFGTTITSEQRRENQLEADRRAEVQKIDKLLHAIALVTGRPAQIEINGKVIAREVVQPEVIKILDELGNHLTYRRPHK